MNIPLAGVGAAAVGGAGKAIGGVGATRELAARPNVAGAVTERDALDVAKSVSSGRGVATLPEDMDDISRVFPGDMETIHAAERLGVDELLTPAELIDRKHKNSARVIDRMRKDAEYGETLKENAPAISERILGDIKKIESKQMGEIGPAVKKVIREKQEFHHDTAKDLYGMLKTHIPKKSEADVSETMGILREKIDNFKKEPPEGYEFDSKKPDMLIAKDALNDMEFKVFKSLNPETASKAKSKLVLPDSAGPQGPKQVQVGATYDALNDAREAVGAKYKSPDWPSYKYIYGAMTRDQDKTLSKLVGDENSIASKTWKAAKNNHALEKSLDKDMTKLFGNMFEEMTQDSLVKTTSSAMSKASKHDTSLFKEAIEAVPESHRGDYLSSALLSTMPMDGSNHLDYQKLGKLWANLQNNKDMVGLLKDNMDPASYQMYSDLGKISQALNESKRMGRRSDEGVKDLITGRKNALNKFMSSMLAVGIASGGTAAMGGALPLIGGVGASVALIGFGKSLMSKSGEKKWEAFSGLFRTPEFLEAVKSGFTPDAIVELAKNNKMQTFAREFAEAEGFEGTQRWINQAIRAERNLQEE
jgi:hypothetical protein